MELNTGRRNAIIKHVAEVFDGDMKGYKHRSSSGAEITVMSCPDSPHAGMNSYSTLGVCEYDSRMRTQDKKKICVEFAGFCDAGTEWFSGLLASCAFGVMKGEIPAYPGAVYNGIISAYDGSLEMKHLLLIRPFGWKKPLGDAKAGDELLTWLMVNPISDAELAYMKEHGQEALLKAFSEANIRVFDLHRKSIF